ncbi:MAG: peptide-methionine (S)-S-oxide reductase [Gammaproteobacteria bacterium CG_4_10_14_0_8_um_filter_38_16]|nr:MAG: peptide-methionine (S)-S-oxide reductase [Gammaproteobacteria bacterium CG_4_10_14_0_8_um_filter_38_16]PJA03197.1 MAG: peptide-methionine (S)-S-oxide reductase [Gammaproteobacteria bacterium CG_4_10_14_0_2_um_filter_38_22]PJB10512.1 MAG: peptide-methionine (S)-S-oxide reductase [Gammaproteobacteria bacterium CG_4_9_14_3_um_filter_38_9]
MYKYASLTPNSLAILKNKNTEAPFSGKYHDVISQGSYLCRGCGAVLFRGDSQFQSSCGWPSFDDEIEGSVKRVVDIDGRRTEILCSQCDGHLGHVFLGEQFTKKNQRHCVNALAIEFVADQYVKKTDEAIVAGGCFWGIQYLFQKLSGILLTEVGYTGGHVVQPTYHQVCSHETGHVEAVRIIFDVEKINYEKIIQYFFEIHDASQVDGQGPDLGSSYLSRIFYFNDSQKTVAINIIKILEKKGLSVATTLKPVSPFWVAEADHQDYYKKTQTLPYCHRWVKRF